MICGIDEAGRGPVIGPLVIAGIFCSSEAEIRKLREIGVKDSKKLSRNKRFEMYRKLIANFKYHSIKIEPPELDRMLGRMNLNQLEAMKFAEIINTASPSKAYIDCADASAENFQNYITKNLICNCDLIIEHKADEKYPVVAAASIIAKVERDAEIQKLAEKFGDIGSGYTSDPKTIAFIQNCYKKHEFPDFVRKSWKTVRAVNSRIDDFQ